MSKTEPTVLQIGEPAPEFTAQVIGGEFGDSPTTISLCDFRGKTVILYFYPKDDTPGCTTQACGLRDQWTEFQTLNVKIFGVSIDSIESHRKFIAKHHLPFPILADTEKHIVSAYQVWVEKSMYGKKYLGTERSTFVIAPDGTLQAIFRKIKPAEHVPTLLKALKISAS